ncbi:DHH family phosphoesterase [Alkaliphilus serpentinus]|uniref:Bifunctional oligoribonuclease/PAP phosphatase NrnA n=1 Tax=Alkaliphilus serpentinus TaxID=1482731 RepID=A0A833M8K9_9FIRM|nr:bifunctional oligoribonuclease/PAP phosphatase NrnA [Alkaliphilus serpentinus]KAB3531336.1 bifunctional oligoribonuclease/PAP phosphatase NrnA [Alkaliphilus serpentinus]
MNNLKDMVFSAKNIAVISHINPDGDSLGSALALAVTLSTINSNVTLYINDVLPAKYEFLPEVHRFIMFKEEELEEFDITFVLDCGDIDRLGSSRSLADRTKNLVNIDHHVSNNHYGDINIIDVKASSTSQMVYHLIDEILQLPITPEVATCLYVGIVTDTGSFKYDNTSPETHRVVAKLLELGVDIEDITIHLFQNNSYKGVKFLGEFLKSLEILIDGKLALATISLQMLNKYSLDPDETDSIINYGRDIKGVEVAVTLKEVDKNLIKISLRSKTNIDVNEIAKAFGGGGHKKASGATLKGTIEEVRERVVEEVRKAFMHNGDGSHCAIGIRNR